MAVSVEVTPAAFWQMTARELDLVADVYMSRQDRQMNVAIYCAWLGANLSRAKKIDDLDRYLVGQDKIPQKSGKEVRARMSKIKKAFGA